MPTLTTVPSDMVEIHEYGILDSFGSGMFMRRNSYPAGRKHRTRYRLSFSLLNATEASALVTLFNAGGEITWTPPGGTAGNFVVLNGTLGVMTVGHVRNLEIEIEEA